MVKVVWIVFALLAAAWTGMAWACGAFIGWAAEQAATGSVAGVVEAARTFDMPPWAALWIDPALWAALKSLALTLLEWGQAAVPYAGTAGGWLVALVWVMWGVGLLALLATAGVSHLLVRQVPRALAPA